MKQFKQLIMKNKILCVTLLIILIGIIVVLTAGFNVETVYRENSRILVNVKSQVNVSEIKEITDEVFGNSDVTVQPATKMNDYASISVTNLTEENKTDLVNKLNEKYGLELTTDDLEVEVMPHTRLVDLVKPYVVPFIIATLILAVYVAIRFRKLNAIKAVLKFVEFIVLAELLVFSLIAIFRIPVGKFLLSEIIVAYVLGATVIFKKLENSNSVLNKKAKR
jgi:preprotein translocase subunit SecF